MKTAYNARYDNDGYIPDFLRSFFEGFADGQLLPNVRHAEESTRALSSPEKTILVYDDMGAQDFAEEPLGAVGADDVDFTDVGEMRR